MSGNPIKSENLQNPSATSTIPLKTPTKVKPEPTQPKLEPRGLPDIKPVPPMPDDIEEEWSSLPSSFTTFFKLLVANVTDIHDLLLGTLRDIQGLEEMHNLFVQEISTLDANIQKLQGQLGAAISYSDFSAPNVWTAIDLLLDNLKSNIASMNRLISSMADTKGEYMKNFNQLSDFDKSQTKYWNSLKQWIIKLKEIISELHLHLPSKIDERLSKFEEAVPNHDVVQTSPAFNFVDSEINSLLATNNIGPTSQLVPNSLAGGLHASSSEISVLLERLVKLEDMSHVLQQRTSGDGVSLGEKNSVSFLMESRHGSISILPITPNFDIFYQKISGHPE